MRAFVILSLLSLVGCATQRLNDGLQRIVGQPVDVLVGYWGYPVAQREIMGRKLYIWSNDGGAMAVPVYGGGVFAARLHCEVQVAVNRSDIVMSYQWSGNNGGCSAFARRLPY